MVSLVDSNRYVIYENDLRVQKASDSIVMSLAKGTHFIDFSISDDDIKALINGEVNKIAVSLLKPRPRSDLSLETIANWRMNR